VTGAAAGLGRAEAIGLASAGATVVVNDIDAALKNSDVVDQIAAAGGTAAAVPGDISQRATADDLVAAAEARGSLDIVVNNAGILVWEPISETTEANYDELMDINVKGTFALTRHACRHWRAAAARGEEVSGRIINTTSGVALFGFPRGGLYGTSKGAIVSLTKVTAMEMRPFDVTANVIWPEARTRMGKGIFPEAPDEPGAFDPYDPDNVSPVVAYLASDGAGWVTGQVFYVQGDRVQRIEGWHVDGEYHSESGRSLTIAELRNAIPLLHHALPPLQPGTSLQDAMQGIDPGRPD
jgi:NAD(P)-dependent dehydrogenase (short-subunit alcohol dehydrogenase family)